MELANMIPKEKTTLEKILSSYKVRQASLWALDMCGILISVLVSMILTWKYQNLDISTMMLSIITVSYTHLTLPTSWMKCRSRWSPYH